MLRDRVARLVGVLRQIAVAKNRPVRHANQYLDVLWLSSAHELGLIHAALEPGQHIVRVPRVPNEREPGPPSSLRNRVEWVRGGSDDLPEPKLRQRVDALLGPVPATDFPRLEREFASWMRVWRPWAERERARRPRRRLYEELFELQREAIDRPESVELVLSTGLQQLGRVEQAVADDHEAGFADVQVASGILTDPAAEVFRAFADFLEGGGPLRKKLFRSGEGKRLAPEVEAVERGVLFRSGSPLGASYRPWSSTNNRSRASPRTRGSTWSGGWRAGSRVSATRVCAKLSASAPARLSCCFVRCTKPGELDRIGSNGAPVYRRRR
ncbi:MULTISPECIES: hypothetical protein [Saccharothrix]|uniref:hypothetical protein n=1 Tax=Saccharothrix TaxID=2071 RepID=UPI001300DEC1|nr:hypothetical protein [Saccharothrix sp. CB00851]